MAVGHEQWMCQTLCGWVSSIARTAGGDVSLMKDGEKEEGCTELPVPP